MLKRIAAVAALSLVPLAAASAPADAARSCGISVPSKVSIYSPYRTITGWYSAGCRTYADWAVWSVVHPTQGTYDGFVYDRADGRTSESLDWYDWNPTGTYSVRPEGAYDRWLNDMTQNSRTMTVKLGSKTAGSSSRSGRYVTVKATATRYSPYAGSYRAWSGAKVSLRQKSCSSCSWRWVASGRTNSYGRASIKTYASTSRYWQIATVDTSTTWGRASGTLRR